MFTWYTDALGKSRHTVQQSTEYSLSSSFPDSPSGIFNLFFGGSSVSDSGPSRRIPTSSCMAATPATASAAAPTAPTPRPAEEEPGAAATPTSLSSSEDMAMTARRFM